MGDQWEEGRRQLKISRARLAKRKLADSAKEVLKTTNLGRTTIANARAVTGRTANIPVKNMKTSMALERPKTPTQKVVSKITSFGKGALKIATPLVVAQSAYSLFGPEGLVNQTFNEAVEHGKKRGERHRRKAQIPKAKHVSKIIQSSLNKLRDR